MWRPRIGTGRAPRGDAEIAIAPKAAADLGVGVGDAITAQVVGRGAGGRPAPAALRLRVAGLTGDPFRAFAYADASLAARVGLAGVTDALSVLPAAGRSAGDVQRALARSTIVATTRPVTADSDALADTMDQFRGIIQVAAGAALVLAVLMAFNLAGISLEERRREYATMFAYGLPVRRALGVAALENLVVGVLGTALGAGIGLLAFSWMNDSLFADTWPEIAIERHLTPASMLAAVLVGVVAVTVTPYLMARRLRRMDVPSTLRVVE
jgi:putative ABC transport system permease protein